MSPSLDRCISEKAARPVESSMGGSQSEIQQGPPLIDWCSIVRGHQLQGSYLHAVFLFQGLHDTAMILLALAVLDKRGDHILNQPGDR